MLGSTSGYETESDFLIAMQLDNSGFQGNYGANSSSTTERERERERRVSLA
jgi:hypothetical protein